MLNQLLKNPAVKYQTLPSTGPIELVKHTLVKQTSGVKCKSIIVRFTTFRHRTMFYHSRKNLKRNVKVKLDLTKKRYSIFTETMQLVKDNQTVKSVMIDSNCRLKVVFKDGNSLFFSDCDNLRDILNKKGID